jgi:hypothetical protein
MGDVDLRGGKMREQLQIGQMIVVDQEMDLYPRRAADKSDFDDMLFNILNDRAQPGDIFTIVDRSDPRFHKDDTWYHVLAPDGSTAWLMDCHHGVFYTPIPVQLVAGSTFPGGQGLARTPQKTRNPPRDTWSCFELNLTAFSAGKGRRIAAPNRSMSNSSPQGHFRLNLTAFSAGKGRWARF